MSFGALSTWQGWLLVSAAAGLAVWLFLLKLRPPRIITPSLLLWRRVLDESRTATLWERIRRAVSLVATALIAVALALAVARPSTIGAGTGGGSRQRTLVVLDSSWSMLGRTKTGETRWNRAVAEARRVIAASAGDEVALATTADGLVEGPTPDAALLETMLDRLAPAGGRGAWPRLAEAATVHFITDGSLQRALDPDVIVHSVFEPAANVAITAFDVRPALTGADAGNLYIEIANFATSSQQVHVTLTRGTSVMLDRQVDMAAGEAIRQAVALPAGGDSLVKARVDAPQNALAADDEAQAWIDRAQPIAVTVVGEDTKWLSGLLGRFSDVRATFVRPADYQPGAETAVIFDRWTPPEAPVRPAVLLAPQPASWLHLTGDEERRPRWTPPESHPVLQGVDLQTLSIEHARAYEAQGLVPIVRSAKGMPLVYVEEQAAHRLVVLTFGPGESNLAAAPGFPVLVGNALDWLSRPQVGSTRQAGPTVLSASTTRFVGADGKALPLLHIGHNTHGVAPAPGLYTVESGAARSTIAVNVGDPEMSNLERTSLSASARARAVAAGGAGRAWWLYCAMAAFVLALVEWWTWQRRITV